MPPPPTRGLTLDERRLLVKLIGGLLHLVYRVRRRRATLQIRAYALRH